MKILVRFLLVVLLLRLVPVLPAAADHTFNDVAESDYQESILNLAHIGVIEGYEDGTFRPKNKVNRAELLKITFAALDASAEDYPGGCFPDVNDEWFAPYVCQAKDFGIVKGYANGFYRPGDEVNMAEALKIVVEAFDLPVGDHEIGEEWYVPYIEFAHENNLFSKYSYLPSRSATRAEIAFLVDRMVEIQREETYIWAKREFMSEGCGQAQPSSAPTKFLVDGVEREAIVVIPDSYEIDKPLKLVFAFHGRTNSNARVRTYYGIEKPSDGEAIVVYPAGIQKNSGYTWSDSGDPAGELRDYEFFDVIYEELTSKYCVNVDEVYAVGHSLGAWFTNSLACARGNVLRGVASLGGSRTNSECTGPVAAMQWHNPNDQHAGFGGAITTRDWYIQQNECSTDSVQIEPSWGSCVRYEGCFKYAPVLFCPHTIDYDSRGSYYPHTWPKGTGEEMWKFFETL